MFGLKWRPSFFLLQNGGPLLGARLGARQKSIETVYHRGHMNQLWCFWKNLNQTAYIMPLGPRLV